MAEDTSTPADQKKKPPLKMIIVLASIFIIEGAIIAGIFMVTGKPADVKADPAIADMEAMAEQLIEEIVVEAKYPNTKSGRTYIYDAVVYVVVKQKYQGEVRGKLDSMTAQVNSDVREIIGRAEPSHLLEPTLATIKRQIKAALDGRLGRDEEGRSRVEDVVITRFTRFRADL